MAPSDRTARIRDLTRVLRPLAGRRPAHAHGALARLPPLWLCVALGTGCGPTLYVVDVLDAEQQLEQARVENARFHAPYEYHAADAYLEKAREEAAEGQYEDAIRFAQSAAHLSRRALQISEASKGAR